MSDTVTFSRRLARSHGVDGEPAPAPRLAVIQLVCGACGGVEPVAEPALLAPAAAIARDHGFSLGAVRGVIRGTCGRCLRRPAAGAR